MGASGRMMLTLSVLAAVLISCRAASSLQVTAFSRNGVLAWSNAPVPGICTVQMASTPSESWLPGPNAFATNSTGSLTVPMDGSSSSFRIQAVPVPPTPQGFTNLVYAYGIIETIAGNGFGGQDNINYWSSWYEGGPATLATLSRPHIAMADRSGNVYIADKNSQSILKVTLDGTIHTYAGTHTGGFNGEGPAPATTLQLNNPNGLWVRSDGTVYVLDTDNGRVRRVDTSGTMSTLFLATSDGSPVNTGRGIWVRDDEGLAYFCAGTKLRSWTPSGGLKTLASNFIDLGTLYVEPGGDVIVCDRGANYAYRVRPNGTRTILAGNSTTNGGGDGFSALSTGLYGVRSPWPMPTGGYLLLTHEGCQLWYLDTAGIIHLLLNGVPGYTHSGDGAFFYDPSTPKIGEGRAVTMDYGGNILICDSDYGYIRRIRFQRMPPGG
jgi:DNA-binding beta-propeller fold protein YncE